MMPIHPSDVFVFPATQTVLIRLPSFEWDFSLGLLVRLQLDGAIVDARQIGTGNHEGKATIVLAPTGDWERVMADVRRFVASGRSGTVSRAETP